MYDLISNDEQNLKSPLAKQVYTLLKRRRGITFPVELDLSVLSTAIPEFLLQRRRADSLPLRKRTQGQGQGEQGCGENQP